MKERLINHVSLTRRLRQLLVLLTLLLLPAGMWAENVSTTYTFTGTKGSSESGYQYDVASTAEGVNYTWRVKNFSAKNENQANMVTSAYVLSETSFGISNIYSSYDKSTIIDFMLESDFTLTGDFVSAEITYSTTGMSQSKAVVYKVAEYNYTLTDATVALGESPATLSLNATDYKSFEGNKIALQFTFTAAKTGNSTTLFTIESIKITTDVTTYPLWVGGTQVTSGNLSDVKDNNISEGRVSFDPETNTLTLNNATIDMSQTADYPVSSSIETLKVKLLGDNTFKLYTDKPYAFEYTGEENTRTLTFETEWQQDEYGYYLGLLKIDNTTETENVANGYTISNTFDNLGTTTYIDPEEAENMTSGWKIGTHTAGPNDIEPDFVKVWKLEVYDLWIGSGRVISSALEAGQSGGPRYNPVDQALEFTSLTSYPIKSSLPELVISVNGSECGINYNTQSENAAISFQATDQQTSGTLKFVVPAEVANNQINKFTVNCDNGVISGFSSVTFEEPLVLRTPTEEPDTWDANTKTLVISNIDDSNLFGGGDGTDAEHAYVISSPLELKLFADKYNNANSGMEKNCYVELGDDIDCTDLTGFTPIGLSSGAPFWGKFDGKGYTISKLTYSTTEANGYTGLFGVVGYYDNGSQECYVQNLNLENCSFSGGEKNGAIAAIFGSGTIRYCNVTNCSISTSGGIGSPLCGGIAGEVTDGAITNCTVSGLTMNVSTTTDDGAPFVGGIAGQTAHGVSNCIVTGTEEHPTVITGTTGPGGGGASGGIVGLCSAAIEINNNMVSDYTTIKSIDPTTFNTDYSCAGAIVGNTGDGTLTNNIYYYSVTTSNKKGEADAVVKDGYTQRGIGNSAEDGSGVEMYTRSVTLPGENEQGAVIAEEGTYYGWNASETGVLVAPGQTATINVNPGNGYTIASLTATNTTTEEPIETDSEECGDGIVQYTFEMPDADVTLNVTFTKSYDLWIGETQVTELNADDVLKDCKVSFTPEDATNATPATLTLNGAALTAPLVVGLENLTIDIQGENSITTDYTCIQTMDEETTPSLTFKSTSSTVGSLTLTNTDEESLGGVLSSDFFGKFTISKELALILFRDGYTSNSYYLTAGEVYDAQFVPSLGVQVGDIQVYEGNKTNVLYDEENPTVVYDVENHKLTLNGARISGAVSTSLENLTIELVGNNSIYQGGSYATLQSMYGDAVTMTIQSTGATPGTLTMNQPYTQAGTFADEHVTLDITSPLTVLSGSLTGNKDNENTVVIGAYTVAFAGTNSWATYYSPVDLAVPEDKGLTAYPVSSVNETTGVVTVPEQGLSYIPANTGVLLKRTDTTVSDYAFTAYTGQTTSITSILQGTSKATSVGGILEGYTDGSTVYVLYNDAFVKTTSGTIPANRGFLVFGDELNAPRLTIEIEGDVTGINTVQGSEVMDNDYYDLSGRKLSGKPTKSGLYIKNGTKVLVK